jgi:sulfonate transport system substrate-binding protein
MTAPRLTRRATVGGLGALALAAACRRDRSPAQATAFTLTVGYQRSSWGFLYLKRQTALAARLAAHGATLKWLEFTAGPPILEGINVGSVDIALVGDAPPVFAQASGLRFAYAAVEPPKPEAAAVIVAPDAPLKTIADLRGKQVALQKGSSAHHLLLEALRAAGLAWTDIRPAYLAPPDARAAFEKGHVDAWAIWDPHYAAAEVQLGARALTGPATPFTYRQFLVVRPELPTLHRSAYDELLAAFAEAERELQARPEAIAAELAADARVDAKILARALARGRFGVQPISDAVWREQQELADQFAALGLVKRIPDVRAAALGGTSVQAAQP